jgi:uncharacterized protein YjbI with pentapeptide repeats
MAFALSLPHWLMQMEHFYNTTFNGLTEDALTLQKGEYEKCLFKNLDLSNKKLFEMRFFDCEFINCNVSMANTAQTVFSACQFTACKMLGLHFDHCSAFGLSFSFTECNLSHSVFYKLKIPKTQFNKCVLHECDFTETDLSAALFKECDLLHTKFERTLLEKADLSTAINYSIDPELNKLKKAKFSMPEVLHLLDKYGIIIDG